MAKKRKEYTNVAVEDDLKPLVKEYQSRYGSSFQFLCNTALRNFFVNLGFKKGAK